ncbi:MAG: YaiO family outer membrane beta-barrel protein [Bacteroidota bacterium]
MTIHQPFCYSRSIRISLLVLACISAPAFGQLDTVKLSSDELFAIAREKAFEGKREEARALCRVVLKRSPAYNDVRILLGRTLAWDGRRDEARKELLIVLDLNPENKDALDALIDVELWDERFEEAYQVANRGLRSYPNEESFLLKKARALKNLQRHDEALFVLFQLEDLNPSHAEGQALRQELSQTSLQNEIGLNYASDRFSDVFNPMHYGAVQISRRTRLGTLFARLNHAERFQTRGQQGEVDFYPRIADGWYGYLSYGYSNSDLFPKHRFGLEAYAKLPKSFEASLGLRHLAFDGGGNITIYTGSLGYYFKSYWVSLKPYITPNDGTVSVSFSATIRWYLLDAENYLSCRIGAGYSADDRLVQSSSGFPGKEVFYLKSQTAGLGGQVRATLSLLLLATGDVGKQELSFRPGEYVTIYSFSLGTRFRF